MGAKHSKSDPLPEQIKNEEPKAVEKVEEQQSKVVTRDIRSQYLTRIGLGQAGEVLRKYQGMTARDFKVPQSLGNQIPPDKEDEKSSMPSNELSEKIASNDYYNLSFIQVKTADDIRRQFLQRMSKEGVWLPPSQRPPKSQSIIIFDWDDTLLCTTYLNSREDAMNITSKVVKSQLKTLEDSIIRLLTLALSLGNTYIITNAMKGWVEYSSGLWIPGVLTMLEQITVISARSEYEHKYPDNYHQWKIEAFMEMTKLFDTGTITNLICLGDSNIEMDAAHHLVQCYQNACIKTIKFRDGPNPEELVKQLELVTDKFEKICTSGKNLTIRLERKPSPR
ncbi:unnamed protein product [Blepharisma stoltei]|uniref:Uncharacterized protein n=1 Tax=Blepharisma stoltei TaxID=1481888 RepID=A0AAU9JYV7_9CILI|nr:unnamed protein product [Blepharisma stoltei]